MNITGFALRPLSGAARSRGAMPVACLAAVLALATILIGSGTARAATLTGQVEAVHTDNFKHPEKSRDFYNLKLGGKKRVELVLAKGRKPKDGARAKARGKLRGGKLYVRSLKQTSAPAARASQAPPANVRVAVIPFNFQNNPNNRPFTVADATNRMFNNADSVAALYREESMSRLTITGQVFDWRTIPVNSTGGPNGTCDTNTWFQNLPGRPAGFNRVVYVFPSNDASCGFGGFAGFGPDGNVIINGNENFGTMTVSHELGHNFDLNHSNALDCRSSSMTSPTKTSAALGDECTFEEYADHYDVETVPGYHFTHNSWHKAFLGFLPGTASNITADGTWVMLPGESDPRFTGTQTLRIPRTRSCPTCTPTDYYYLEFRRTFGTFFDVGFTGTFAPVANGVTIRIAPDHNLPRDVTGQGARLIDTTPNSTTGGAFGQDSLDAPLAVGRTYTDADSVNITTQSISAADARCGNLPCAAVGITGMRSQLVKSGSFFLFDAGAGQNNNIKVFQSGGRIYFQDQNGWPFTAPAGCLQITGSSVSCPDAGITAFSVNAKDLDDTIDVDTSSLPATLRGGNGNDTVDGDAGADTILGSLGNDLLYGRGGNDLITDRPGGNDTDRLDGSSGNDTLHGGDGDANDRLYCGAGTDSYSRDGTEYISSCATQLP